MISETTMQWVLEVYPDRVKALFDAPLPVAPGTLVGFMFGELITLEGRPQFGNLMAVRLVPVKKP